MTTTMIPTNKILFNLAIVLLAYGTSTYLGPSCDLEIIAAVAK